MGGFSGGVIETEDNAGSSAHYSGTATTTPANVPSSADKIIEGVAIWVGLSDIEVSFDNGTSYTPLGKRSFFSKNVKGQITQIKVKTATGTSDYEILLDFGVS